MTRTGSVAEFTRPMARSVDGRSSAGPAPDTWPTAGRKRRSEAAHGKEVNHDDRRSAWRRKGRYHD